MEDKELENVESVEEVTNTEETTANEILTNDEKVEEEKTEESVVEESIVEEKEQSVDEDTAKIAVENVKKEEINESYELIPQKKKSNKGPFIAIAIIVVLLATILYFVYTNISNPKKMFVKSINKEYKEVENVIDDLFINSSNKKAMVLSNDFGINIKVDESLTNEGIKSMIEEINKIKVETKIGYDQKNKQMLMNVGALYDKDTLIDLGAYAKDENMYFELKDLFDKYIKVPMDEFDTYFEESDLDKKDLKYVLSKTKDAFINNLDEDNFKKSSATIKIDGKNVKTTKVTYAMSEKDANVLSKKALSELSKDSKYIEALATISGKDKDEIKDSLEESLDEIKEEIESDDLETEKTLSFVVYLKGVMKKTVGYEIVVDSEEKGSITYIKGDKKDTLKFIVEDEEIINATISDNKFMVELTSDGETVSLDVLKKEKDKKTTYSYTLTAAGTSISGDVIVEMIKENKDGSYEAKISSSASVMGMVTVTISGTSKAEYSDNLDLPNVSNSVDYEELTEEDMNTIKTKLMENKALVSLIAKISTYANGMSTY